MVIVGLGLTLIVLFGIIRQYMNMEDNEYKIILEREILLMTLIGIIGSIIFIYTILFPKSHLVMIMVYIKTYKIFVVWYFLELVLFIMGSISCVKKEMSRYM